MRIALPLGVVALLFSHAVQAQPWLNTSIVALHTAEGLARALTLLLVIVFWLYYEWGARNTPVKHWRRMLFRATAIVTLLTILGPLDYWAGISASAHMTQHMVMIVVIAPLFALSNPLPQFYAVSAGWVKKGWTLLFKVTQYPMLCAYLHGFMIWFWHIPVFYMLAVRDPWVHAFEHACFLLTAIWFWWSCLHAKPRKVPFALLALLFTLMHTGFLGALLTFANAPLYDEARHLQDQQLAGLLMWVLGGVPYIIASIWAGNRWYKQLQRRMINA